MKPKARLKVRVDILMTFLLLFLMGYQFWGDTAHEWAGAGMFALFMIHHLLNVGWHKNLLRGKYSPSRILMLVINILLFADMLGLMISGILLSNHVFAFLGIRGSLSFARLLHMASAYWGFVLMSLHLGLHWGMILGMIRRSGRGREETSGAVKMLLRFLGTVIAAYGLIVFLRRDLLTYMLIRTQFVFLDFNEPVPLFYIDYLSMMGTFVWIAYYVSVFIRGRYGEYGWRHLNREKERITLKEKTIK